MTEKKKICFYSILSSGHLNVCTSIGNMILNKYSDQIEIWFVVDRQWEKRLGAIDSRFKFGAFDYEDPDMEARMIDIVDALESTLKMNPIEKLIATWKMFIEDKTLIEVDTKSEEEILKIKPDLLICDQGFILPAMVKTGTPYAMVVSANPLIFDFEGFPTIGSSCRVDDEECILEFKKDFVSHRQTMRKVLNDIHKKRGSKYADTDMAFERVASDHFCLYSFPMEMDYYTEEMKQKNRLWQIDTPLYTERIPKPFVLPVEFAALPGKIVYVSLGSLFSAYTHLIQRLCDILEKLPYKYIVSKGPNGDKLKFPSDKFIGENYVNQLAVLQVADAMIAHGGNNTFGECFYFGCPSIILPVLGDQPNNAVRIEETGYGFQLDIMNYTEKQLADCLEKILNDQELRLKWRKASERIQRENRISSVVDKIVEHVMKL